MQLLKLVDRAFHIVDELIKGVEENVLIYIYIYIIIDLHITLSVVALFHWFKLQPLSDVSLCHMQMIAVLFCFVFFPSIFQVYIETSSICRTLEDNNIVDQSDLFGASPFGATTSAFEN